jgi:hypothetical protein
MNIPPTLRRAWIICLVASFGSPAQAAIANDKAHDNVVRPFLVKHCLPCHGEGATKARLRLDRLPSWFAAKGASDSWAKVYDKLRTGLMPPSKRPQPSPAQVRKVLEWIQAGLIAADKTEGRVVLRRLNRVEYENTLHDLLGIDTRLRDLLPEDENVGGFDNNARALRLSAVHLERYLEAADRALDHAICNDRDPPKKLRKKYRFRFKGNSQAAWTTSKGDYEVLFGPGSIAYSLNDFHAPREGRYRVRIRAFAYQSKQPVTMRVAAGDIYQLNGSSGATGDTFCHLVGYYDVPPNKANVVEFVDWLRPNDTIRIDPYNTLRNYADRSQYRSGKIDMAEYTGPGLAIGEIEIEGPLVEQWPPESHRRLLGKSPLVAVPGGRTKPRYRFDQPRPLFVVTAKQPTKEAEGILRKFLPRAFRRPVTGAEVRPFLALVTSRLADGYTFEEALRVGLKAVLCSSDFLYRKEKPGRLDGPALASRLSYFLWTSMPDEALLNLAAEGKLTQPAVLRQQVERMLRDPKAHRFTENFLGQWLQLRDIGATMPDPTLYPEYDELLKVSSVRETELFFEELLANDLSLLNLVDSDFAMLNERLAWHYGIPGVQGQRLRKVTLPKGSHRGGVLTQASVLKVTANGTNTSPVLRGAWVLKKIVGQPSPPPPANIPAIEPDIRGAVTIRDQLAKHRQNASCATCHNKIDPAGFALEGFDPIGGRRDFYRATTGPVVSVDVTKGWRIHFRKGRTVDASGETAGGKRFRDVTEFKRILLEDKDQVARNVVETLLVYATGSVIRPADRAAVEAIVAQSRARKYGLRNLIHEVVQSRVFLNK